jgi:hypothetical protein
MTLKWVTPRSGVCFWVCTNQAHASLAAASILLVAHSRRSRISDGSRQFSPRVS